MKKLKAIVALLLAMVMLLAFAACSKPADDNTGDEDAQSPSPSESSSPNLNVGEDNSQGNEDATITEKPDGIQEGTVFTYWTNYDVPLYCPWIDNRASALLWQVYDNLMMRPKGDATNVVPCLAESYELSDDGLTYVFQIRQDAYFTDGEQVTAEAFVNTWSKATEEYQARYFAQVESYEATGEFELTVKLIAPSATILQTLFTEPQCGPVSPKALDEHGKEDNGSAVGVGPYYIESYTSGEGFVLKANPNYYNEAKQPSIETCKLVLIPDENTALIALDNGEIDCMNFVSVETYNVLEEKGWQLISIKDRVNPFWFNPNGNELFKDPVVREALCHLVDWEAVNELAYDGRYTVPTSYWDGVGGYPYDESYAYDPDLGIQMLEDAGYSKEDIKFTFQADPDFVTIENVIVGQLRDLGFTNVDFETVDGATMYGRLKAADYECFPCHNGYSEESPLTPYTMGLIENGAQPCMFLKQFNEEAYNEAMAEYEAATTSPDYQTYCEHVSNITKICQENHCAMGGLGVTRFYGISNKISGVFPTPIGGYVEFCYMWVNEL